MIGKSFSELTDVLILAGRFPEAVETARRGLGYLERDVSVERVQLIDGLSQALAGAQGYEPPHEAFEEAMELASQVTEPKLLASVVCSRSITTFYFCHLRQPVSDW